MSVGSLFFVIGLVLGFLALLGIVIPADVRTVLIVLVCYGLGLLLAGVPVARVIAVKA